MSKNEKHLSPRDRAKRVRRQMIHDLVKDGLNYKTSKKLVDNYSSDPITFSINYNDAMNKLKGTSISLDNNEYWPAFSIKNEDMVPPVFRIQSTYAMSCTEIDDMTNIAFPKN